MTMKTQNDLLPNWTIRGTAHSSGGSFQKVTILGEAFVDGDLDCEKLRLTGTLRVEGALQMTDSKIMGSADVTGNVSGHNLRLFGELNIKGDCSAESFKARGTFNIDGMLNAGDIEMNLYGPSHAREIGGASIQVKPHFKLMPGGLRELTADTIEGDDIRLLNTRARVVRGNSVTIGSGCEIELIEYKTNCNVDAGSKVTRQVKL
jgi:cytoskeletal protein CcmA (bactofilin family)